MLLLPKHLLFFAAHPLTPTPLPSRCRFRPLSCTTTTSSSATTSTSRNNFSIQDYLVNSCHLYPGAAVKVSKHLSHLKSPSKPDAVLAFLAGIGLTPQSIAVAVCGDPKLLTASVDKTLTPRVAELRELGFSAFQITQFVWVAGPSFRSRNLASKLRFWLPLCGGRIAKLLLALKANPALLTADLRKVVKPNIALLQQCGLTEHEIAWLAGSYAAKLLTTEPKDVEAVVARAEELGVPRGEKQFPNALVTAFCITPERKAWKLELFKELGCSEAQAETAVTKLPTVLLRSEKRLRRSFEFLTKEVGLDVDSIVNFPAVLMYDLERRLVPRNYVLKLLKEKRLLAKYWSFQKLATMPEKDFVGRFVRPFNTKLPHLADGYAAACAGKVPTEDDL